MPWFSRRGDCALGFLCSASAFCFAGSWPLFNVASIASAFCTGLSQARRLLNPSPLAAKMAKRGMMPRALVQALSAERQQRRQRPRPGRWRWWIRSCKASEMALGTRMSSTHSVSWAQRGARKDTRSVLEEKGLVHVLICPPTRAISASKAIFGVFRNGCIGMRALTRHPPSLSFAKPLHSIVRALSIATASASFDGENHAPKTVNQASGRGREVRGCRREISNPAPRIRKRPPALCRSTVDRPHLGRVIHPGRDGAHSRG